MRFRLMLAVLAVAVLVAGVRAQKVADGDWPMYAPRPRRHQVFAAEADHGRQRRAAAARLEPHAGRAAGARRRAGARTRRRAGRKSSRTPRRRRSWSNGVMYLLVRRQPASWRSTRRPARRSGAIQIPDGDSTGRGVAYWPGDRNNPERIDVHGERAERRARRRAADGARRGDREAVGRLRHQRRRRHRRAVERRARSSSRTSSCSAPRSAKCRTARPATRGRSTRAPGRSCGSFTPCRGPARSATRRG